MSDVFWRHFSRGYLLGFKYLWPVYVYTIYLLVTK